MALDVVQLPDYVPRACVIQTAQDFRLPETLLLAVLQVEGARPGFVRHNTNDTIDVGLMQINTRWHGTFRTKFGVTVKQLTDDACISLRAAAYVLCSEMARTGDLWSGVAAYHSRNPWRGRPYAQHVYEVSLQFAGKAL